MPQAPIKVGGLYDAASMRSVERLIAALADAEVDARAFNQYSRAIGDPIANATRRRNLRRYLEEMHLIQPRLLLIGEAPSHRGGRLTGIPFVSETLLLAGVEIAAEPGRILGADRGYRKATPGPQLSTEASATIVWGTIRRLTPLPLLWNAFPFHPHEPERPSTNRAPAAAELLMGQQYIDMLLRIFRFERIAAVGNLASLSLTRMGIAHEKVRHPSQGGKQKFVDGVARLSQNGSA